MLPINIPNHLPAKQVLESEHIFVMDESRAFHQDIRPQKIVILNLMPKKIQTETQLLRLLGNSPLQVHFTFLIPSTHTPKNTARQHLDEFYTEFSRIRHKRFDGMIITGAPIEHLPFEDVSYWEELKEIMEWSKRTSLQRSISAGALKPVYTTITELRKWRCRKKYSECLSIPFLKNMRD